MFISVLKRTVAIRYLQIKEQSGDRKLKFDWHNLINKEFLWVLMLFLDMIDQ